MNAFVGGLAPMGKAILTGNKIEVYDSINKIITLTVDESVQFPTEGYVDKIDYFTQVIRVESDSIRVTVFFDGSIVEEMKIGEEWYIKQVTSYYVDRKYFNWHRCYVHVGYEKQLSSLYWLYVDVEYPTLLYTVDGNGKVYKESILYTPIPLVRYNIDLALTQATQMMYAMEYVIFGDKMDRIPVLVKEVNQNYAQTIPRLPTALSKFENTLSLYFRDRYIECR